MNLAQLVVIITVIGCAVAAGGGAASEGAGRTTVIYIMVGLPIGIACAKGIGWIAYTILGAEIDLKSRWKAATLCLAYMFVPMALAFGCMFSLFAVCAWVARMLAQ